tara:strand:- start:5747 stop:8509 length:2763 start_codon:yes stop_codon:yes gene_type:complete
MNKEHKRLIEEMLPTETINIESQREKNLRHGHISTLHQWWSRKPLVAARAAVFATLMPAPLDEEHRKRQFALLSALSQCHLQEDTLAQSQQQLTQTYPLVPPRLLDPFSGGGSIPLEALRLGCEVYANDINPVAYLIQLCTLVYPQTYGPQLADEVQKWGQWVRDKVAQDLGDLYPPPTGYEDDKSIRLTAPLQYVKRAKSDSKRKKKRLTTRDLPPPTTPLRPEAYLWTRTVQCHNPHCKATVPLLRKGWISKRPGRYIAMKFIPNKETKRVCFEIYESQHKNESQATTSWKFQPLFLSKGQHVQCFHCHTTIEGSYIRQKGQQGAIGLQPITIAYTQEGRRGKRYLYGPNIESYFPDEEVLQRRLQTLCEDIDISPPDEPLPPAGSLGISVQNYGFKEWSQLFTTRQMLALLTFCKWVRAAYDALLATSPCTKDKAKAIITYLAFGVTKLANRGSTLVVHNPFGEKLESPVSNGRMAINWDVAEANPLGTTSGNFLKNILYTTRALRSVAFSSPTKAHVSMSPAQWIDRPDASIDAVITDPPYYDNVPYGHLSDYFYIWLKRILEPFYEDELARPLTPKKRELVADRSKHNGDPFKAREHFERGMQEVFQELHRVLVPEGPLVVIYAHKTTTGWSTLINSLRRARFVITESWPLATERAARLRAQHSAALASSLFLVARKRKHTAVGRYLEDVRPRLAEIVHERIRTLFSLGFQGADLVLACVGSCLQAFTQFERVELPDGTELDTETFLQQIQHLVVKQIISLVMEQQTNQPIAELDTIAQFYILTRFQFGEHPIPFGELDVLAKGLGVELEGPQSLSDGAHQLITKKNGYCTLNDFQKRGATQSLSTSNSQIDLLHRLLWLSLHQPQNTHTFLETLRGSVQPLRWLAQALSSPVFSKQRSAEQKQLDILLASWSRM